MTIDLMWEKFEAHQPEADRLGYGEAWRRMCEERTEEAARAAAARSCERSWAAVADAWAASAAAFWAAKALSWTAFWAERSPESAAASKAMGWDVVWAERAIEYIERAEGEQ